MEGDTKAFSRGRLDESRKSNRALRHIATTFTFYLSGMEVPPKPVSPMGDASISVGRLCVVFLPWPSSGWM